MPCLGRFFRRHRLPVFAYGFVSFFLLFLGVVFSAFAIFERKSVISKVWLAGPTTMAVGLVLCGKVIIDCRPSKSEEEEEEEEYIVQADDCQKNRFMEQHQLNKVRDSLITLSNVRARKSLTDNEDFGEDKCPDYDSVIWNVRDDETTLDTVIPDDDSLCLPNANAFYGGVKHQQQQFYVDERHCSICLLNKKETEQTTNMQKIDSIKIINADIDNDVDKIIDYGSQSTKTTPTLLRRKYSGSPKVHRKYSDSPGAINVDEAFASTSTSSATQQYKHMASSSTNVMDNSSSSHSPLYQGEIFLFNDRQYLI